LTGETFAIKLAEVEFAGTVTVDGNTTAASLLARLTLSPPDPAAALRVIEQESVAEPETVDRLQVSFDRAGAPDPLRAILVAPKEVVSVPMTNCPFSAPTVDGLN
jgi:hypothetical protein